MVFGHPRAIQLLYLLVRKHLVCQEEPSKFKDTCLIQNTHSSSLLMHCLLLLSDYWIFSPDYVFEQSYPLLPSDHDQSLPHMWLSMFCGTGALPAEQLSSWLWIKYLHCHEFLHQDCIFQVQPLAVSTWLNVITKGINVDAFQLQHCQFHCCPVIFQLLDVILQPLLILLCKFRVTTACGWAGSTGKRKNGIKKTYIWNKILIFTSNTLPILHQCIWVLLKSS